MTTTYPMRAMRQMAWQRLPSDRKTEKQTSAQAALQEIGAYDVQLVDMYTRGEKLDDPLDDRRYTNAKNFKAIMRMDNQTIFDVVSANYRIITPTQFAELLDEHIYGPVECFAHLRGGRKQVAVYTLPSYEVLGDEISSHLIFINELSGHRAIKAVVGDYRYVCLNGQVFYSANGTGRIFHDSRLEGRLREWLGYIRPAAIQKNAIMKDLYEALAKEKVLEPFATFMIEQIYPMPKDPDRFGPPAEIAEREAAFERERSKIVTIRGEALALYQGAGMGQDTVACQGTAYGLLQAIMELEEYRPGRNVAESNMIGERQDKKREAFNIITGAIGAN